MPGPLQTYLLEATPKASDNLVEALLRLPEDKRGWSPMGDARTALDMVAECAILNGRSAEIIRARFRDDSFDRANFDRRRAELSLDWPALKRLLDENTSKLVTEIGAVEDGELGTVIVMPWGSVTLAQYIGYPSWNMSYHEGQINYIASMLGCLT